MVIAVTLQIELPDDQTPAILFFTVTF